MNDAELFQNAKKSVTEVTLEKSTRPHSNLCEPNSGFDENGLAEIRYLSTLVGRDFADSFLVS
jgi:hypothetical protein